MPIRRAGVPYVVERMNRYSEFCEKHKESRFPIPLSRWLEWSAWDDEYGRMTRLNPKSGPIHEQQSVAGLTSGRAIGKTALPGVGKSTVVPVGVVGKPESVGRLMRC